MKQVQIMAGVHPAIYWLSNYTLSFIIFAIMSILIVFIFSLDWFGDSVLESRFKSKPIMSQMSQITMNHL